MRIKRAVATMTCANPAITSSVHKRMNFSITDRNAKTAVQVRNPARKVRSLAAWLLYLRIMRACLV
jgi:hypothetical protein